MTNKSHNLATQLSVAFCVVRARSCADLDLGVSEQRALLALGPRATRFSDACEIAAMDKGQMSRTFAVLKDRGLIFTTTDVRRKSGLHPPAYLHLTRAGAKARKVVEKHVARADASILDRLTKAERVALPAILRKLAALGEAA